MGVALGLKRKKIVVYVYIYSMFHVSNLLFVIKIENLLMNSFYNLGLHMKDLLVNLLYICQNIQLQTNS